jgi:hypothetical protein
MKIRYRKIVRSTNIDSNALIKRIVLELSKPGYKITNQIQSSLEFKYNIWRVGSRTEVFRNVDGGRFDVISESKSIVFSFYLSPIFEILAISITAFLGITQDYHIFFFVVFITLMFFIRLISVKIAANRMIENIVDPELS